MPQSKNKKINKFGKPIKIVSFIIIAFLFYAFGYFMGHKNLIFEKNLTPKILNLELAKPRTIDFGTFWKAWDIVQKQYVGTSDAQKMVYGAIAGMVQSLGDPYSMFLVPSTSKTFMEDLSGQIQGIGAELSTKNGQLVIVSPISGTPADAAGLKPNDQIIQVNDTPTDSLAIDEAINLIRGNAGTTVKLTIVRDGWAAPQVFEIKRAKITIKSVDWSMKGDMAYIRVSQFGDDTTSLMTEAAKAIMPQNPKAIILDLRHNPGGYLESAVDMVGDFSDPGVVVKEKYKDGHIQEEKSTTTPVFGKSKLIILIDEGSASASEIVAGALQDDGRATLVGAKSFGKGSVQDLEDLGNGATLRLTIAEWLTPKDRAINHIGIQPDVKVSLSDDDIKAGRDPQLDKAMELANQ